MGVPTGLTSWLVAGVEPRAGTAALVGHLDRSEIKALGAERAEKELQIVSPGNNKTI